VAHEDGWNAIPERVAKPISQGDPFEPRSGSGLVGGSETAPPWSIHHGRVSAKGALHKTDGPAQGGAIC